MKKVIKHENIEGMARVGVVKDKYEVYVNTDDSGNIPHFHFRNMADWDKFHTCIRIDKAEYFLHEGKDDILNNKLKKELQKFMVSKPTSTRLGMFDNNWEFVCAMWDINNSNVTISADVTQPDYRNLPSIG